MTELQIGDPIQVRIKKFDPSQDSEPYYQSYTVPYTKEMRVLEALDYIVEELGESIAYHWFCGVKKCGMCAMKVNGKPVLACWEPVEPELVLEPLDHFPVIRDLVIDRNSYVKNMIQLDPFLDRGEQEYSGFPEPLVSTSMEHAAEMAHCIECMICVSVCPTYGSEFMGPAPLVQLARWTLDPRDTAGLRRAKTAVGLAGIENCVSCYECTEVCPANIPILEWAVDGLRKNIVARDVGAIAHHNHVFKELTLEQGLINPATLLIRSRGVKVLGEFILAIRMWLRGRLSLAKVSKGMLKQDKLTSQQEIRTLEKEIGTMSTEGKAQ